MKKKYAIISVIGFILLLPIVSFGMGTGTPALAGIKLDFIIFALTLVGVAVFHKHTMYVAITGLVLELCLKLVFDANFSITTHIIGNASHEGEWRTLVNLLGLLFGFSILAKLFEDSGVPSKLPKYLPSGWKGGFVLLILIAVISSFLDNIAAALIGGAIAMIVYNGKVHIGYIAAIIAASNAGGAGSVVGDTTTTLMWIDGVNALWVTKAFIGSLVAVSIFGVIAARQQHKFQPIIMGNTDTKVAWNNIIVVALILVLTIITNWMLDFPALGVWIAILIGAFLVKTPWKEIPNAFQGSIFLMALVFTASLMPVEELPLASWPTAFSLGFVSAVFDNIPLTKLCLEQGGYDWGILSFAVGFGGSMIWFGSSAGVALTNMFPKGRSVISYLKAGWHITFAYIVGFIVMLAIGTWNPHPPHKKNIQKEPITCEQMHSIP
jgi:Na+/H+ antiporter NhaD/arsenite permease-like protein